ncbi:acyltransferase family protein [Roseimarinus sediminis]|uniref:acyltransferase family protein n=1 Tax=Roseimarinus sediminis TaxID=1610899 RepID=UPI003D1E95DC
MEKNQRIVSLDALRGFTVAGMILVNVPGSWNHIYPPLRHAEFNGLTLADLVFPFFLFIVGASIVLALGRRLGQGISPKSMLPKILYRSLLIFLMGILLNWMSAGFEFPLRLAGVLQRIALCYLAGALLFLFVSSLYRWVIAIFILLAYLLLMVYVPVPGEQEAVLTAEMNWAAWVDAQCLPGKKYFGNWDPEGLLSTFPAIVTTLFGMFAAQIIQKTKSEIEMIKSMGIYGNILLFAGIVVSAFFPLNKNIWSSSFVLLTAGLAAVLWSVLIFIVDVNRWQRWAFPGIVFGANAITAYVLHYLLFYPLGRLKIGGASLQSHFMEVAVSLMPANLASLLWALFFTFLCFLPVWLMYRKKIFLKV